MRKGRAFTLVELMSVTAVTSLLVGAMASLYMFSAGRTAHAFATGAASNQIQKLSQTLDRYIGQATSAQVVTSGSASGLKCIMPATGFDSDGDGTNDAYEPSGIDKGVARFGLGQRVWFYMSDASGNFMSPGPIIRMAIRNDDAFPTGANVVNSFTYEPGTTKQRYALVDQVTWSANANDKTATYTIRASSLTRDERKSATAYSSDKNAAQTASLTRVTFCENWRQ